MKEPKISFAFAAAIISISMTAVPFDAYGACAQYKASGQFQIQQNNGFLVSCTLVDTGGHFQGNCGYSGTGGDAQGEIAGRSFTMRVFWGSRSTGNYTGTIMDDGSIANGRTYDVKSPTNWAIWWLKIGRLTCQ